MESGEMKLQAGMKVVIPESVQVTIHGLISRGVQEVEVSTEGHLIFTLTDGSKADIGNVVGPAGASVESIAKTKQTGLVSTYTITMTDGQTFEFEVEGVQGPEGKPGKDGAPGRDGADGETPTIGENGNWYIGGVDTGEPSRGEKGDTGATGQPGTDGAPGRDGADGETPTIGENGNWYIGGVDTGKPSRGEKGDAGGTGGGAEIPQTQSLLKGDGAGGAVAAEKNVDYLEPPAEMVKNKFLQVNADGGLSGVDLPSATTNKRGIVYLANDYEITDADKAATAKALNDVYTIVKAIQESGGGTTGTVPTIGENGNWYIDGVDTGKPSRGEKGDTGATGQPGADGAPGKDGADGAPGKDGADGAPGKDGAPGADGKTPVKGTDYYTQEDKEEMVDAVLAALPTWTGGSY